MPINKDLSNGLSLLERDYCVLKNKKTLFQNLLKYLGEFFEDASTTDQDIVFKFYNELLIKFSSSEKIIKSKLASEIIKEGMNVAFEVNCLDTRLDLLAFDNELAISYEIKSKNDNLYKLQKQINNYCQLFDHNYVVADEKHLKSIEKVIPDQVGIIIFSNLPENNFIYYRNSQRVVPDPFLQIQFLTKSEKIKYFNSSSTGEILEFHSRELIANYFLKAIESRFNKKNIFLKSKLDLINPVDYQYFFKNNVDPELIYG